jgi:hypothetical protein
MKFCFDLFNLEITATGARLAVAEIGTAQRAGALLALEVDVIQLEPGGVSAWQVSGDLGWFSFFAFKHGGAK